MSDVRVFGPGGYRFINAVFQYSGGVAAEPGHRIVRVRLAVSAHWRGLPIASPEGWACAYWLMGEYDEPALRERRATRAELLFAHLERTGVDRVRLETMLAESLPAALASRLRALLPLA